jgi:transcriptional regulator with XRE-family HTH domain
VTQKTIIEAIENRLVDQNWSRRKLAREAGMNHATLSRKLNGAYSFTLDELFRICLAFEVAPAELLGEEAA